MVHNLTIGEDHTFAVGPDAVLVHNTGFCDDNTFKSAADAIGDLHPERVKVTQVAKAKNVDAIANGFTEHVRIQGSDGRFFGAFRNPTTGRITPGHLSSSEFFDGF